MAVSRKNQVLAHAIDGLSDPYYAAFGRFITRFANTEGNVRGVLEHLVGTNKPESAALFYSLMIGDTIATINRLLAARAEFGLIGAVKEPFARLQKIAEVRNALVHWSASLHHTEGVFVLKNTHRAHLPAKAVEYRVGLEQLAFMSADLIKIDMHLIAATGRPKMSPEIRAAVVQPVLDAAWTYIPPEPTPQGKGSGPPRLR